MVTTDERIQDFKLSLFYIIGEVQLAEDNIDWRSVAAQLRSAAQTADAIGDRLE